MSIEPDNKKHFPLAQPDHFFLASESRIYEYSNLYGFIRWFSKQIREYPVDQKKPVALLSRSSDELVFAIAACWHLQIPFFPLSPAMTDSELDQVYTLHDIAFFITDDANRERVGRHPRLTIPFGELQNESDAGPASGPASGPDKIFGYFLTSGTTGRPKVVPLRRRQMLSAATASAQNVKPDPNRFWLHCLPFHHIGGISIVLRSLLFNTAIYRADQFHAPQIASYLSENLLFQVASLVPTMLKRLFEQPHFHLHNEFKAILLGGGPVSPTLLQECEIRGVPAISSYGMTETCAQIAANPILHRSGIYHPKTSVGVLFRPNEVEIRSDDNKRLPSLESGQIWLRGPQVFDGYLDEELNRKVFDENGWFRTGDVGHLNRKNQLFIEMRRTDLILSGGENVNPVEVEQALESIDQVREAAVVGIDDEEWGQRVVAFIVTGESRTDTESIKEELKTRISSFKVPKEFVLATSLPRTPAGKVNRLELLKTYSGKKHGTGTPPS